MQGVGFRPFIYRLANKYALAGWVLNADDGVHIHIEGLQGELEAFVCDLRNDPPLAARITHIDVQPKELQGLDGFVIRGSIARRQPTVRVSPDLPVCEACLTELFDPSDPRRSYPYINCTNCGPRYSIIQGLPYDRSLTTMQAWALCTHCAKEYSDPANRRFHAQPVACSVCGPDYYLEYCGQKFLGTAAIRQAAAHLKQGRILAIKGLGGYHLACDALNRHAVGTLRERKYRKEKPFALMVKNAAVAGKLVALSDESIALLTGTARPIVLAPGKIELPEVALNSAELGLMLPYTPLHHLLFSEEAPEILVMTSANRSNEPIAYLDGEALKQLDSIADGLLIGERPIARRVDDSVVRDGAFGPVILRRSRGYAPEAVATLPTRRPVLALGADLKSAITLVVEGQAFVSQHIGDLEHEPAFRAFQETIQDLMAMYQVQWDDLLVVHDRHPHYRSTNYAVSLPAERTVSVQHHRAHIASVLAEKGEWHQAVIGVSLDGTGYGDDGTIWGSEIFAGSVAGGFDRITHLRHARLPGGDAAAHHPVQAAAGFLNQVQNLPDLSTAPFHFPVRYQKALQLVEKGMRSFPTTSMGRLFDTAAALLGFTRAVTFEGQAAIWLETLARTSPPVEPYPFPFHNQELDFIPLLEALLRDRLMARKTAEIARAFQTGVARGLFEALRLISHDLQIETVVLSGGVFQNDLLLRDLKSLFDRTPLQVWTNHAVPPNDGGISLGQAALAVFRPDACNDGSQLTSR